MKKAVVIKTGDTFPAISSILKDFEDWIIRGLGVNPADIRVVDLPHGRELPDPFDISGAVIAGSHAMVTQDFGWSVKIEKWLPHIVNSRIPVLGICYGHQLLAKAMGGKVAYHPGGLEIGTTRIARVTEEISDPLFNDAPPEFNAHVCHFQTVSELPEKAVLLAKNDFEPHHAFRIGSCAWGVQFHPEYDETIMAAYAENMKKDIDASDRQLSQVLAQIGPTPVAAKILRRFGRLIT